MQIFLQTERLILRRFTADDVEALCGLDSDPAVMRFINGGRPTPRHLVESEILPRFLGWYEQSDRFGYWAAIDRGTGEFVGWFHLWPQEGRPAGEAEIGYRLHQAAWGKGYATEGATALVAKAFTELGVERVTAQTMTVNRASRRVMEKAGLRYVRTFHLDWPEPIEGTDQGDVEYALTRAEWEVLTSGGGSRSARSTPRRPG